MKKYLLLILTILSVNYIYSQNDLLKNIELVESIPIETTLDNPEIRNTPEVWLEMINRAKRTLDIEQFYISNQKGEPLEDILDAIIKAGKRGVNIRIIADARMYKTYPETIDSLGKLKNISTRIIDFGKLAGGIQHSKYFIVDRVELFLGSQNFDWRALKHIHELGIRIKYKDMVKVYQDIFDLDWKLAEKNDSNLISKILQSKKYKIPFRIPVGIGDTALFYPTYSPKELIIDSTLWDEENIINLIDNSTTNLYCQFLTYSPLSRNKSYYATLDNALRRAAIRGVKVKTIVSDWSKDHPTVDYLKSLSLIPNIEIKFSSIPDWSGGYIPYARVEHCKFIVTDGSTCWIGTSNAEKSYFYTSRNLGIIIQNNTISKKVENIFLKSWNSPYTELIKPEIEYKLREHGEK